MRCCRSEMIAVRYYARLRKWIRAWFCTDCGRLVRLDYRTGRLIQIWPGRRAA
jgi:hypothetical protein